MNKNHATISVLVISYLASLTMSAQTRDIYYAHPVRTDQYGVIAPWNSNQNGPLDERMRIAIEVLKRYPWVDSKKAVIAAPDFIYNSHWSIEEDGTILIPPTNDWMCGDLAQRAWSIIKGLTDYYAYSGDPIAFTYIPLLADYILGYAQTPTDADWPNFPIATPTLGKAYGKCLPNARNQLDLCAIVGIEFIRAYKLTYNEEYLNAAKHWGDVFAEKATLEPGVSPWNRYTDPSVVGWSDELTGSITMILDFLDELIALGYTGENGAIVKARDAGIRFLNDCILPKWLENDSWGRQYWDWDNPVMCGIVSMCGDYIMKNPDDFPNWKTDLRNILTLIFNRNSTDQNSHGNMFHGAWAWPESSTCCGSSLSYNQYTGTPTLLRYGLLAKNDRIYEIGRRATIMSCYDSDPKGVVKDGLFGNPVATGEWSNLAHPWPLCQAAEAMKWTPEIFAPKRENHIIRTTSVVTDIIYSKGKISYTTFDAPERCFDVLRLSFRPDSITADGKELNLFSYLPRNGYSLTSADSRDYIVTIRHDGAKSLVITGQDPQTQIDDIEFSKKGIWDQKSDKDAYSHGYIISKEKNSYITYEFTGNQVRLIGRVDDKGGLADVYLDGKKQLTYIDCWAPAIIDQQVLYSRSGLENGKHTLKIVVKGEKRPLSSDKYIYIDALQFSQESAEPFYGQGSGPGNTQRMIFGYPKRKDYIDTKGNAWHPATEWVIRSGYGQDTVEKAWWTDRRSMYIGNTKDEEIYRYGVHGKDFWANLTVGPGEYFVRLHFANTPLHQFLEREGKWDRVQHTMNIHINGQKVLDQFDVKEEAGGEFKAVVKTFKNIQPVSGAVEVWFTGTQDREAMIQALEIGLMENIGN